MKKQIKALWLKALKSGNYKKGRGRLRSKDNEFCCLGVLCDIYNPDNWALKRGDPYHYHYKENGFMGNTIQLNSEINRWAEFDDVIKTENSLVLINDSTDTFEEVIKYIDENL